MKTSHLFALGSLALLTACSSTQQAAAPSPPTSFLSRETTALLRPTDLGSRLYINPSVDFRRYSRVMIEPVQLWLAPNNTQLNAEQRQLVANALHSALREELGQVLQLVERPGPGTMVITTAFTEVRAGGNPVLSTVSTFVPASRIVREGVNIMTGSDPMVGGAAAEMRVTDSETGQLLAAAIDSSDATAGARVRTSRWDDVQTVARYWATQTANRVCRVQQRPNCQPQS
ncbi:DUF3313 domain-containing protein [Falsiroseomonas sp. E2-1-a20]|uniref:DUF3313 domain-containing protein n=1 Tax=Falsiroseomonas sp. E2-1-a20 TaxID=3239300 RepID=UPI003F3B4893